MGRRRTKGIGVLNSMNSRHLRETSTFRHPSVRLTRKEATDGVVYDLYKVVEKTTGTSATITPRASGMVIRREGNLSFDDSTRHVEVGDILIVPPATVPVEPRVFDIWTLSAAGLILLATARIFL